MTKTRTILTLGLEVHVLTKLTDCRLNDSRCVLSNNTQSHARQGVGAGRACDCVLLRGMHTAWCTPPDHPGHPVRTLSGRVSGGCPGGYLGWLGVGWG